MSENKKTKTSVADEMDEAYQRYFVEGGAMLVSQEQFREWAERVAMAEADASRFQDVCDVLTKHGLVVHHEKGQDEHEVIDQLLSLLPPFDEVHDCGCRMGSRWVSTKFCGGHGIPDDGGPWVPGKGKRHRSYGKGVRFR